MFHTTLKAPFKLGVEYKCEKGAHQDLVLSNSANGTGSHNGYIRVEKNGKTIYKISTKPKHTALTLDNQSIVASKALLTQTSNSTQVFTQELDYDSTAGDFGDDNKFDQLTSGTLTDLNGHTVQTKVLLKPSSIKLG